MKHEKKTWLVQIQNSIVTEHLIDSHTSKEAEKIAINEANGIVPYFDIPSPKNFRTILNTIDSSISTENKKTR